uniref:Transmembrane 4 L six family member 21a n=1 Tax=Labrus bergylta TaxID=56723 RepID=A0A3Q3GRP9_9LABR
MQDEEDERCCLSQHDEPLSPGAAEQKRSTCWDVKYAKHGHLTKEVYYMGGAIGGGFMVLIPALYINRTGEQGCCGNRFGMFLSIVFAAAGAAGALYSFIVALLGLGNGPLCKHAGTWTTPFKHSNWTYLTDSESWGECTEPTNVVQFNIGLFGTLMASSCLQCCSVRLRSSTASSAACVGPATAKRNRTLLVRRHLNIDVSTTDEELHFLHCYQPDLH